MDTLNKIWTVTWKDLLQVSRDRGALLMMFVVPLALVALLGSALGNAFNAGAAVHATVPVVDRDRGPGAAALIAALRHDPKLRVRLDSNVASLEKAVRNGDQVGLLIIPTGFSAALGRGTAALVTYYSVANNASVAAAVAADNVQAVVQRFAYAEETARVVEGVQKLSGRANPAAAQQIAAQAAARLTSRPPVAVSTVNATGRKINSTDNTVPGYALMFALFGVMAGARSLLEEKESGTLRRLLIAPLPSYALLAGKLLAQFIQSVVQITVLFGAGALLFHIDLGSSLPALALLVFATSFAATGLGMILVSFIRSERQVRPITMLIVLSFSALGGSWWPISVEPAWMQNLAKLTVNGWAMQGFNGLMIFDQGFMQVLPDIAALFAYGVICLAIARRVFRFTEA